MAKPDFDIGVRVAGRYEVREILGAGTLGAAYKVFDHARSRPAVLKALPEPFRQKAVLSKRFIKHCKDQQARDHAGFPKVLDVGIAEGIPYAVWEFLDGLTLRQLLNARRDEGTRFQFDEAESIVEEIGQILSYLHQTGFHGAVKPENVFLLPDRIKLTDDGLMNVLPPEVFARVQVRRAEVAPYLAPEILSDPKGIGKEVDIFGAAAITYELLAGEPPAVPPRKITDIRDDLPARVGEVIGRGLADQPSDRYPSINTYLLDLARIGGNSKKIKLLESVVEAEAREAVGRTADKARAEPAETEVPVASAGVARPPARAVPSTSGKSADAAHLFEDESLPPPSEQRTGAPAPQPAATMAAGADLLQPVPTISASGAKGGKGAAIAAVVSGVFVLGGIVAWLAMREPAETPAVVKTEPVQVEAAASSVDDKMSTAAARAIESAAELKGRAEGMGATVGDYPQFATAVAKLELARAKLSAGSAEAARLAAEDARAGFSMVIDEILARRKAAESGANERDEKARKEEAAAKRPTKAAAEPAVAPAVVSAPKAKGCPPGTVEIPAGSFMAGSPPDDLLRDATERQLSKVDVAGVCIDKHEFPNKPGAKPKTGVSIAEAEALCAKDGRRLCSELEWEKACKGPRGNDFPYGKVWDPNRCNTETATGEDRSIAPIGAFARCESDYGVLDLSGNVMEWTASKFEQNPALSIAKGGSFKRPDYAARCAYRYTAPASTKDPEIGFRCCIDLP